MHSRQGTRWINIHFDPMTELTESNQAERKFVFVSSSIKGNR